MHRVALASAGLLVACTAAGGIEDPVDATFVAPDGKADAAGIAEGDLKARLVLRLANEATHDELVDTIGLSPSVATAIVSGRASTESPRFSTLVELDAVPHVGRSVFDALAREASARWIPAAPDACPSAVWEVDTIGQGRFARVEIDRRGIIHALYLGAVDGRVVHLTRAGGGWSAEDVPRICPEMTASFDASIDAAGFLHVTCGAQWAGVWYSTDTSGWHAQVVYDRARWVAESPVTRDGRYGYPRVAIGQQAAIVVDGPGAVHLLFHRDEMMSSSTRHGFLQHATWVGRWQHADLDLGDPVNSTLVDVAASPLEGRDVAVAAHLSRATLPATREIRYADTRGTSVEVYQALYPAFVGNAAVASAHPRSVVYERIVTEGLGGDALPVLDEKTIAGDGAGPVSVVGGTADLGGVTVPAVPGSHPTIASAADGTAHLVFASGATLMHARRGGGATWQVEEIATLPAELAAAPSVSVQDGSGLVAVAAVDAQGAIHVARQRCR